MAHFEQLTFVELTAKHINKHSWQGLRILEIGSHNVNGSVKQFFNGSEYIGVDLSEGEYVDVIASGHEVNFQDKSFHLAISCECFEHNPKWVDTFKNMYRMTKNGGVVIITCASKGRPEHGTTRTSPKSSPGTHECGWNYYKNLNKSDFEGQFDLRNMFHEYMFCYNKASKDLFFVGKKIGEDVVTLTVNTDILLKEASLIRNPAGQGLFKAVKYICKSPLTLAESLLPEVLYQDVATLCFRTNRILKKLLFIERLGKL